MRFTQPVVVQKFMSTISGTEQSFATAIPNEPRFFCKLNVLWDLADGYGTFKQAQKVAESPPPISHSTQAAKDRAKRLRPANCFRL